MASEYHETPPVVETSKSPFARADAAGDRARTELARVKTNCENLACSGVISVTLSGSGFARFPDRGRFVPLFEVRFHERSSGIVSVLEVAAPARRSVLDRVRHLLFELRVQIVRVESVVRESGLVERFHVVELDGAPISRRRAAKVRGSVRKALRGSDERAA